MHYPSDPWNWSAVPEPKPKERSMMQATYQCPDCKQRWTIALDGPYVQHEYERIAYHMDIQHGLRLRQQIQNYVQSTVVPHLEEIK